VTSFAKSGDYGKSERLKEEQVPPVIFHTTRTIGSTLASACCILAEGASGSESGGRSTPEEANVRRPIMNRFVVGNTEGTQGANANTCMERASLNPEQQRRWLKQLREMPDVRLKKIMKIRSEIAKGTYETEAKWRVALERLLEDLRD
jgi:hypothetical protein